MLVVIMELIAPMVFVVLNIVTPVQAIVFVLIVQLGSTSTPDSVNLVWAILVQIVHPIHHAQLATATS